MYMLNVEVPNNLAVEPNIIPMMKKGLALELYKTRKYSLGYCADLANMTKEAFMYYLSDNGVSVIHYDSDKEFEKELENARKGRA